MAAFIRPTFDVGYFWQHPRGGRLGRTLGTSQADPAEALVTTCVMVWVSCGLLEWMDRATQPARSAVAEHSHGGKKPIAAVASVLRSDQAAATRPCQASGHFDPRCGNAVPRGHGLRLAPFGDEVVPLASGCLDRRRASAVS